MYILKNYKALILTLIVILSELIYVPFKTYPHSVINDIQITYGDVLYELWGNIGYASLIPCIWLLNAEKKLASKAIYLGLIVWNIIEIIQSLNTLFYLDIDILDRFTSIQCDICQIGFIVLIIFFTHRGFKKWHT